MTLTRKTVGVPKVEARLVASLRRALIREATGPLRRSVTAVELDSFQGVADLVIGEFNGLHILPGTISRNRLKAFSFSTAKLLATLDRRKVIRVSQIAEKCGLSLATVRKELRKLRETKIIDIQRPDRVRILHLVSPPFKELVAFEVKVKDWKSGLRQARSYKSFANQAYLALPQGRAELLKDHIKVFKRFNVGLVGVGSGGRLHWHARARRSKPISLARYYYASLQLLINTPRGMLKSATKTLHSQAPRPN
jgi:DNA-binding transcriptional ArsR family regulator